MTPSGFEKRLRAVVLLTVTAILAQQPGVALADNGKSPGSLASQPFGNPAVESASREIDEGRGSVWEAYVGVAAASTRVEIDHFAHSIGEFEVSDPFGTEIIHVSGPATVHVFFEGSTEGTADDDDTDGFDEVTIQMVDLNLTGLSPLLGPVHVTLNPNLPSFGEIEETANNTPGVLDLPPFAPTGTANSYFNLFFKIEVGGQTYFTIDPKQMRSVITHKPPGPADIYQNLDRIELYDENGVPTGVFLDACRHRPTPPIEIDQFDYSIGEFEVSGPFGTEVIHVSGPATVHVFFEGSTEGTADDDDTDGLEEVTIQMVDLNLTGLSPLLGPVHVTLNPNLPSFGEIEETANNAPGILDLPPFAPTGTANSYFNLFFKIEVGGQTYFTINPKQMRSVITHKPPGPTDIYQNLDRIELYDENGEPTGVFLDACRHRPTPPIEIDQFAHSIGRFEVSGPFGTEVIHVSGPTTVHVFFEGSTEGTADDDDTDGLDEVTIQMVDLNLTGLSSLLGPAHVTLNPNLPSFGEIEETANNTPGVLNLPPFAPTGTANSYFNLFFKIEVGGQTYFTINPKQMRSVITHKPPGPTDIYQNLDRIELYDENGVPTGVFLGACHHRPTPPIEIDQFDYSIGEFEVSGPFGTEVIHVSGPTTVHVFFEGSTEGTADDHDTDGFEEVTIQMVDLNLTGLSPLLGPVHVTLNPNLPSFGEIEETANNTPRILDLPPFAPTGTANSYFNLFFKIEVGGQTYFTIDPKQMRSVITHKPPGPTDIYQNLDRIELYDENGVPTGVFLDACRHRPTPCFLSSQPGPDTLRLLGDPINQKMRYLSFHAGDPGLYPPGVGRSQAVRISFKNLPPPYDTWNGVQMWVQAPEEFCENAGKIKPPCPDAEPRNTWLGATLGCSPWFADFYSMTHDSEGVIDDAIHVYHEGIIPGGYYWIEVTEVGCQTAGFPEGSFSFPLDVTQSRWGDVVGNCVTYPCTPPDGTVGIPTDVTAVLDKFKNLGPPAFNPAVRKARAEHDWNTPNRRVDISDVTFCLDAFRGVGYPPPAFDPPGPRPCSPSG